MKGLFIKGDTETINAIIKQVRPWIGEGIDHAEIDPTLLSQATREQLEEAILDLDLEE